MRTWLAVSILLAGTLRAVLLLADPGVPDQPPDRQAAPVTTFDVLFRPVREDGREVTAIEVRGELRGGAPPAGQPFSIQAPITYASVTGIADRIEALQLRDASGSVPLVVQDDPVNPGGFPYYRHWRAGRPVRYPAVLTYRSRPQTTPPVPGPVFSFRAHHGGISTAGSGFLAVPEDIGEVAMRLHWDLSSLPPGSFVASTFGEGDVKLVGEPEDLLQGYYMAGPLGRYVPPDGRRTFYGYWLGQPAFDLRKELGWAYRVYRYQQRFFGETPSRPYRVFVRALPGATRRLGGTALASSFMLAVPAAPLDPAAQSPRETIAHEMGHMFVGGIAGGSALGTPWFQEGLNVHYTRLLLLRSGLAPVDDYEKSINDTARRYYTNKYRNESAEALEKIGFSAGVGDGGAQNVPYTRGSLYFATVDFKIREASRGRRSLDDVILPLFAQRRQGRPFDIETLVTGFVKEYGPSARTDFESVILRGETIVPPPGAFGPCFDRRPATLELGDRRADGYEWVRIPSVPDAWCRQW